MTFTRQNIFSSIIPAVIISLLFVTPFMVSSEIFNGVVMAKEFWFFGVVALMLFYWGMQLIVGYKKATIELNTIDLLLLAFYTWCFIRAIFTPYTPFWHNHKLQVLTGMLVVYFFVKNTIRKERNEENEKNEINEKNKGYETKINSFISSFFHSFIHTFLHSFINKPSFILSFLIFSFILSGLLQAVYGLLQLYGFYPSLHGLFKITGSFFNPAPYAMYLALVFPVALGKALFNEDNERNENNEREKYSFISSFIHSFINKIPSLTKFLHSFINKIPWVTVIAILLILPATMNRASWLGALAGSLVVLQCKYDLWGKMKQVLNTRAIKITAITCTLIIIAGIGFGLFYLKAGSSNGRMFIWDVTLGKIAEKPLFGHGLGRFEAEYNNWQTEYFMKHPEEMKGPKGLFAGNTKYCFNEYLEIASETGIIGLLLFCSLLFAAFVSVTALKMKLLSSSFIFTIVILSFFSFPFYNVPLLMALIIVLAFVSAVRQTAPILKVKPIVLTNYSFAAVLLGFGIMVGYKLPSDYASYQKWQDASFLYDTNAYEPSVKEYESIYTALKYNNGFLQQYGKACAMGKDYTKAKIQLNEAGKYGSDYMLYANLGDVYKELKQYLQAEVAYLHSAYMAPHKLYPHYLMAKLYMQSGDTIKAKAKAKEVLAMNAKVKNMAEDEIKLEMKKILKK